MFDLTFLFAFSHVWEVAFWEVRLMQTFLVPNGQYRSCPTAHWANGYVPHNGEYE